MADTAATDATERIEVAGEGVFGVEAFAPHPAPVETSPYRGLEPYSEADWPFFFGRDLESEIIIANLRASRLTLLYGPSGIGKTSVLRAGVGHQLSEQAQQNRLAFGTPEHAVVVFSTWRDDPIPALIWTVSRAVFEALDDTTTTIPPTPSSLVNALELWTAWLGGGQLLIVLDQFEEYFLYHGHEDGPGTFAVEFPRAVNRPNLTVNFLVAIREDALAKLDRFKGALPDLFNNYLRLEYLDRQAARAALEKPLEQFNRLHAADGSAIAIEPALTESVLDQVATEADSGGEIGRGMFRGAAAAQRIDTSLLQVVMRRLWNEERRAGSNTLRLETFKRLGSAHDILATHLDEILGSLPAADQEVALAVFHYLVTPSGMKIALGADDLASYTGLDRDRLEAVLLRLSGPADRILRPVAAPRHPEIQRYEIFHDRLADAILSWRARYHAAQAAKRVQSATRQAALRIASAVTVAVIAVTALAAIAFFVLAPPDIKDFGVNPSAIAAGNSANLDWSVDRAARVTVEPAVEGKPEVPTGTLTVTPEVTTEYTLTAHNWIGISSSVKKILSVMKVVAFRAIPDRLTQEKQEATLHWETQGASSVRIEPGDEIKDPETSGDATVHPPAETTYKLIATGPSGLTLERLVSIGIGLPSIKRFEVTQPPPGARIFPGDPVQFTWTAEGATRATISASTGDVLPGKLQLDVTAGPPAVARPATVGENDYTLSVFNAAGGQQAFTRVFVTPFLITGLEADPAAISSGQSAKLRWYVEGANDLTVVSIDPNIGRVEPTGERTVSPTETTEYVLKVQGPGGAPVERRSIITVNGVALTTGRAPLPVVTIFSSPRAAVTLGDEVRLTWSVQNADNVEIRTDDNFLILHTTQLEGSVQDFPVAPTRYILAASGASGRVTKDITVNVKPPGAAAPTTSPQLATRTPAGPVVTTAPLATRTATGVTPTDPLALRTPLGPLPTTAAQQATLTATGPVPISITSVVGTFLPNPSVSGAFAATPSTAVAFTMDVPVINFNPPVGVVPCTNSTGVIMSTRPFADVVPQPDGSCRTLVAQGNNQQAGIGDLSSFNAVFTGSFVVASASRVTFNVFSDDGWILSVGPNRAGAQPSYVSGPLLNFPKVGAFTGYHTLGSYNVVSSPTQNNLVVDFLSSGSFPFELDYSKCCDDQLVLTLAANGKPIPATTPLILDIVGLSNAAQVHGVQHIDVAVVSGQATQVELLVDDHSRGVRRTPPFSFDWDAGEVAPGPHRVVVRGTDTAGGTLDIALSVEVVLAAPVPTPGPTPAPAAVQAPATTSIDPFVAAGTVGLLLLASIAMYFRIRRERAVSAPAAPELVVDNTESVDRDPTR